MGFYIEGAVQTTSLVFSYDNLSIIFFNSNLRRYSMAILKAQPNLTSLTIPCK
jgi:hypothetical protein